MNYKTLSVSLFGNFTVKYDNVPFSIDNRTNSKLTQLLQILVLSGKNGIVKKQLIDYLYKADEVQYANRSLNNLIFRLRERMSKVVDKDYDCLSIEKGKCTWNFSLPVDIDTVRFAELAEKGLEETDVLKKIELLEAALDEYKAEFLPMVLEEWSIYVASKYKKRHAQVLRALADILMVRGRFEELYRYATKAVEIYPLDEWQLMQMDCLIEEKRFGEAMDIYEETARFYFQELGISPSAEMMERFNKMKSSLNNVARNINDIKADLERDSEEGGGYCCTYPGFVDVYHTMDRLMERMGKTAFLLVCTITDKAGMEMLNIDKLNRFADIVMNAIGKSLRRSDIYTKASPNVILMLLPRTNYENTGIVRKRIINRCLEEGLPSSKYLHFEAISGMSGKF